MTREEAITILDTLWSNPLFNDSHKEALKLGTQALRYQEQNVVAVVPCGDAISRKSIKQKLQELYNVFFDAYGCFSKLPMLYKAKVDGITDCIAAVENEPSVTPQPKMEKWKIGQWKWEPYDRNSKFGDFKLGDWHCSECGSVVSECVYKDEKRGIPFYKYCPQCGAKMRQVNADEDSD